jgi:hypothetical protein
MIIKGNNQKHIESWMDISGVVNDDNIDPKVTWDLKSPAKTITKAI